MKRSFYDRYQVGCVLGQGAMGFVREVFDREKQTTVACKSLYPEASSQRKKAFLAEFSLLCKLQHPNIIPVYDQGLLPDGRPYYTMKKVEGHTLEQLYESQTLSIRKGIQILSKVCQALEYANQKGVYHHDLKPSNIMVTYTGHVYVIDWGASAVYAMKRKDKKKKYIINGTPLYMAPEIVLENAPIQYMDQYAIGVLLYQLLTYQLPYTADNLASLLYNKCCGKLIRPSARNKWRRIPLQLEEICIRLLRKKPEARYASFGELLLQMEGWLQSDMEGRPQWFQAPHQLLRAAA